ncbi:hypothetical protein ILYODFUR_013964 [Ilyodon furcidens]|uniref:SWIM-type domain-containing protein n=1 Tax=Ilyodon furcidens TaxID=33524 RepID=A0ABV0UUS7_9TELE
MFQLDLEKLIHAFIFCQIDYCNGVLTGKILGRLWLKKVFARQISVRVSDRMSRKAAWRNTANDAVSSNQDQALSTTMLLLRSFGPAAFLLREDGETRSFKVCLGEPHTCTCPAFAKEQQPCKHICWLFLRKFRLPREHEYAFQLGLSERQLLEVLQGLHQAEAHRTELDASAAAGNLSRNVPGQEVGSVCRKVIQAQDVCPICQEGLLLKKQPVSYCRWVWVGAVSVDQNMTP